MSLLQPLTLLLGGGQHHGVVRTIHLEEYRVLRADLVLEQFGVDELVVWLVVCVESFEHG